MKRLLSEELVKIPEGCEVKVEKMILTITGPKGSTVRDLSHFTLSMDIFEESIRLRLWNASSREKSKLTTCTSLVKNALNGCNQGFSYTLKAIYKHFPMNLEVVETGKQIIIRNFLGEKLVRKYEMRGDSTVRLGTEKDTFIIEGSSIEDVSQSAGTIQEDCQVKTLDSRKFLDGVYFISKDLISA